MNLKSNEEKHFCALCSGKPNSFSPSFCPKCNREQTPVELLELSDDQERVLSTQETTLLYNRHGEVRLYLSSGKDVLLTDNQLFLLPPGEEIRLKAESDCSLLVWEVNELVVFGEYLFAESPLEVFWEDNQEALPLTMNKHIKEMFEHFAVLIAEGIVSSEYAKNKLSELLALMHLFYDKNLLINFFQFFRSEDYAFKKKIFLERNKAITVAELASKVNLSRSGFHQHFKKAIGKTPSRWIKEEKARLILADLTLTSKPIKEIWFEYGFTSPAYFNQFCKRYLGDTPARIRKGHKC